MRVVRCFLNADMRNGHEGLRLVAAKEKIDVDKLAPGEFVVFVNAAKDRLKIYTHSRVLAYQHQKGVRINLKTIAEIPRAFAATGRIDYDKALKTTLEKELGTVQ